MNKYSKIAVTIFILILVAWFIPVIPIISWKISGIPGCHTLALRSLKSIVIPNQSAIAQKFRTTEAEKPVIVTSWGNCAYN